MSALQRKSFAASRPVNAVLARFLRAVERLARQYTDDTPISRAVRSVFVRYDIDGSGLIDESELSKMIVELIENEGSEIGIKVKKKNFSLLWTILFLLFERPLTLISVFSISSTFFFFFVLNILIGQLWWWTVHSGCLLYCSKRTCPSHRS